ncbi:MAG: flagellar assembly protein FliX [Hyphomicrobiales bacterium]
MRIEAYGHLSGSARVRAKAKSSGSSFSVDSPEDTGSASEIGGSVAQQNVSLGTLLSLQSSENETVERRATAKGHSLLNELSQLQTALLGGSDVPEQLMALKQRLPELQLTGDVSLDLILREIDLRMRVELAKRGL